MLSADASHLRKYLATLGVAIIVGTISLASLVMRLQSELLVKQSELAELTPIARDTIERRQRYASVVTDLVPFLLLLGCMLGIGLAIYGIRGWTKRQAVTDEIEDLARDRSRTEVRRLTDSERLEKIEDEVESAVLDGNVEDVEDETTAEGVVPAGPPVAPEVEPAPPLAPIDSQRNMALREAIRRRDLLRRVNEVEAGLAAKAAEAFDATHRVDVGVSMASGGKTRQFDAVAFSLHPDVKSIVFEVKYVGNPKAMSRVLTTAFSQAAAGADMLPGGAIPVVVAVYRDEIFEQGEVALLSKAAAKLAATFNRPPRILILSESEFKAMSAGSFRTALSL